MWGVLVYGCDSTARTCDQRINSPLLYQLSYIAKKESLNSYHKTERSTNKTLHRSYTMKLNDPHVKRKHGGRGIAGSNRFTVKDR